MSNIFDEASGKSGGGGSGGNIFGSSAAPSSDGGSHGVFGLLKNLGSDVKGAVEGLPTGAYQLAKGFGKTAAYDVTGGGLTGVVPHSYGHALLDTLKPIGENYAKTYSPLFHGHFGQFAHDLYAHPLGPVLDAASVATLGAGGLAKAGSLLDKAGVLSEGSRLASLSKAADLSVPDFGAGENIVVKQSSRNPLIRLRQETTNNLLNKLPSETPLLGSTARGVHALMRQPERAGASLQNVAQRATTSFGRLNQPERVAWHLNARGLTPSQYSDYLATTGAKVSSAVSRLLEDPRVTRLVANPSKNLQAALDDGRALSDHLTALRVAGGHIDETTALESPYRHLRIVNGATYEPVTDASPALKVATAERDRIANLHEQTLAKEANWQEVNRGLFSPSGEPVLGTPHASNPFRNDVVQLGHALDVAQKHVDSLSGHTTETGAVKLTDKPGRDLETLMKEQGDKQPFYVPDSAHTNGLRGKFSSRPSGFSAPEQGVKQSRGVLFSHGLINFNENSVARDYRSFASQARAQLIHDEMVKHAALLPKGESIPHGYEELKLNRGQTSAPYTQRAAAPLEHELSGSTLRSRLAALSRHAIEEGNPEEPHRLIVPTQVRKILEDNTNPYRSNLARLTGIPQATNVWKHLILGLRPAFFGNITIGNSILGTLQMAPGRWGVLAWLNQVLPNFERIAGPKLTAETMQRVFPEQAAGTFGHSVGFSPNAGLRAGQKLYQGVMPATIAYENVLRRSMAEGWAKADPEVQSLMRANGGDVNAALEQIAKSKPQIINGISRRVDDALGNYRTYNRLERAIKAVVPFYGFNRHLTSSVARLALEHPARLDAIFQTGESGKPLADAIIGALPSYLSGAVGVKLPSWLGAIPGKEQILSTTSWDPFNTLVDEGETLKGLIGKPGATSGQWPINPLAQGLIEQITHTSLLTGKQLPKSAGNQIASEIEHATPEQALLHDLIYGRHPKPTATNQNDELGQLLRYLGLPVENVNP